MGFSVFLHFVRKSLDYGRTLDGELHVGFPAHCLVSWFLLFLYVCELDLPLTPKHINNSITYLPNQEALNLKFYSFIRYLFSACKLISPFVELQGVLVLQGFDLFLLHVHKNLELLILKSKHKDTENHLPSI